MKMYGNSNLTMFHLGKLHNIWMTLSFKYVLLFFIFFISVALIAVKIGFWYILIHEITFCIINHNIYCLAISVIKLPRIYFCLYKPILQSVFLDRYCHGSTHLSIYVHRFVHLLVPNYVTSLAFKGIWHIYLKSDGVLYSIIKQITTRYEDLKKIIMVKCKWSRILDETNCKALQNHPNI